MIGKTVYEAIPEIDKFLNDCIMAGVSPVQIIHGKGTGSLRKGIHDYLKTLPFITDFGWQNLKMEEQALQMCILIDSYA